MKTLKELLTDVPVESPRGYNLAKHREDLARVLDGLKAKRPPVKEGAHLFTPEELLTLYVDETHVNGRVIGYQRELDLKHARKGAQHLREGKPMPTLEIGMDGRGRMYLDDGQHRAAAGVIARVSLWGHVRHRDRAERAELFASQRRAKTINPNVLVLSGSGPFERYVQEAVASSDPKLPWHGIVSPSYSSKSRIGPYTFFQLLVRYVANVEAQGAGLHGAALNSRWDKGLADELAPLIRCFGNKATNPLAFRSFTIQGVGSTAMWVFRRREQQTGDYERWQTHMPKFPFDLWPHLRRQREITDQLVAHWNKGLRGKKRRVVRS